MELPTVCIVNPSAKSGFTRINESDFDPEVHTLYDEATGLPVEPDEDSEADDDVPTTTQTATHVAKGPGGRFYVMAGDERASKGFGSEDEAKAALAEMAAPKSEG